MNITKESIKKNTVFCLDSFEKEWELSIKLASLGYYLPKYNRGDECYYRNNIKTCYSPYKGTFISYGYAHNNGFDVIEYELDEKVNPNKVLNIDKYRDEIFRIQKKENCEPWRAIITCHLRYSKIGSTTNVLACNWLFEEYKEPIELTRFEFDLLRTNDQSHNRTISSYQTYLNMKKVGYYKSITDWNMTIKEILNNYEVID